MEELLGHQFVEVVEKAAMACARTMGLGDRNYSDKVAVEAMREAMLSLPIDGTIVIGEGERDEAPMLYIGEKVGRAPEMPSTYMQLWTSPLIRWKARICAPPERTMPSPSWRPRKRAGC